MNIIIAPDKFKGSLSTFQVCDAIEKGWLQALPGSHITRLPMADGGDGLSEVVKHYTKANTQIATVLHPLFETIEAEWLLSEDHQSALVEMAKASGLSLLQPSQHNPEKTSSIGTGQLLKAALQKGVREVTIGIGGSATNDCGTGMAAALGYRFLDEKGRELKPVGENLMRIQHIDATGRMNTGGIQFRVACDVRNRLCGERGAARVYAPQKGADQAMVERLEQGALHFARVIKRDLGVDVLNIEGGGAAGGLGAGCVAFLGATLVSGIDLVLSVSKMEEQVPVADLVITGEGKLDSQSAEGKVVSGVAALAKKYGKPVLALCGSLSAIEAEWERMGIDAAFAIQGPSDNLRESMNHAFSLLEMLSRQVALTAALYTQQ